MNGGTAQHAFERIDCALARLESIAGRWSDGLSAGGLAASGLAADQSLQGDSDLAQRHERLRLAVSASLRELDSLLAAQADIGLAAETDAGGDE